MIRVFDVTAATTGPTESVDAGSQVCSLLWSRSTDELASTHGWPDNAVALWKANDLAPVAKLTGHSARVAHSTLSPDDEYVVTGAGDETLRFWSVFPRKRSSSARQANGDDDFGRLARDVNIAVRS
jgi:cell division cycle 20-like protein 1 (cofactor of APC complex)